MKILCSSNVEWFDSLDHNKITFFVCVLNNSSKAGLGWGLRTVNHLFSNPHLETKLYIPATPLFAALMLSLVMLLQTFDGWKKSGNFIRLRSFSAPSSRSTFESEKCGNSGLLKTFLLDAKTKQILKSWNKFLLVSGVCSSLSRLSMIF